MANHAGETHYFLGLHVKLTVTRLLLEFFDMLHRYLSASPLESEILFSLDTSRECRSNVSCFEALYMPPSVTLLVKVLQCWVRVQNVHNGKYNLLLIKRYRCQSPKHEREPFHSHYTFSVDSLPSRLNMLYNKSALFCVICMAEMVADLPR